MQKENGLLMTYLLERPSDRLDCYNSLIKNFLIKISKEEANNLLWTP